MFNALMTFLELHGIDIKNCRGQSYDNANSMSGKYSGLKARVKERNPKAAFDSLYWSYTTRHFNGFVYSNSLT